MISMLTILAGGRWRSLMRVVQHERVLAWLTAVQRNSQYD
jgi:hypothetical protein